MNTYKMKTLAAIVLVAVSSQTVAPAFAATPADLQTRVQTLLTSGAYSPSVGVPRAVSVAHTAIDAQVQQVLTGAQTPAETARSQSLTVSTQRPVSSILLGSM